MNWIKSLLKEISKLLIGKIPKFNLKYESCSLNSEALVFGGDETG